MKDETERGNRRNRKEGKNMEHTVDFSALEKNIIGVISEQQIKLGYRSEAVRIYYPLDSLHAILHTEDTLMQMIDHLQEFGEYARERLGRVEANSDGVRFCITIPPQGSDYIHCHYSSNPFLKEFIDLMRGHSTEMTDVLEVFKKYSSKVHIERMNNGEFELLLYFEDGKPDDYYYCFAKEGGHLIYHRFTKMDYENFGF